MPEHPCPNCDGSLHPWVVQPGISCRVCRECGYEDPTLTNDAAELLAEVTAERDRLQAALALAQAQASGMAGWFVWLHESAGSCDTCDADFCRCLTAARALSGQHGGA